MKANSKIIFSVFLISILAFFLGIHQTSAQNEGPAVEQWRSFLPYYQVNDVAIDNTWQTLYCVTDYGFFTYNRKDGSLEAYSKVKGMHDLGLNSVAYDPTTEMAILGYNNGNIDLFKENQFYNIPDLKNTLVSGDKTIYAATADGGKAYLSTGMGLVVINIDKQEISLTVPFFEGTTTGKVNETIIQDGTIYSATNVGLFKTSVSNPNMQNYASWQKLSNRSIDHLGWANNQLFVSAQDSVFLYHPNQDSLSLFYLMNGDITRINPGEDGVWVSAYNTGLQTGSSYKLNNSAQIIDSLPCHSPSVVVEIPGVEVWYGDNSDHYFPNFYGLRKKISNTESESHTPDGPVSALSFDISAYNGEIWVAHGGHDNVWNPTFNTNNFSVYRNHAWYHFYWLSNDFSVADFIRILYDPSTQHAYAGSLTGGFVDVAPDNSYRIYNQGYLPSMFANPGLYGVSGIAKDNQGNLWITGNGNIPELTLRTPDDQWIQMKTILNNTGQGLQHSAADATLDDYGQIWFITTSGNGVVVYNPNGTPINPNDDQYRLLKTGQGNGNLPDNNALCIAKTKDGTIWIGTANGIGIVNCPGDVINGSCEASLTPVQVDEFAGDWLFVRQSVTALAVDAANRKWVGTNNGVWLLNTDNGIKTVYRFTAENSPLPSDNIQRINIDPVTGDVYFSTDKGFVAFRSTAIQAPENPTTSDILIYPNPVPSGYEGIISVKGLPDGADVRFTDITGKLAYRTTSLGGQAVWNGKDYTGHKVQSGVYLVFVVTKDGQTKMTSKFIIQK